MPTKEVKTKKPTKPSTAAFRRDTYNIDATGKVLGRLAVEISTKLRGKHKPDFQYHLEHGNIVNVTNAAKLKVTGKKYSQKKYHHYSGYPGGLKTVRFSHAFEKNPAALLREAVWNMLPKNKLRGVMIRRLKITN